jgi:signal transduction histidine kinase
VRLAVLFFAVFLASGAAMLAITVAVWQQRTGALTAVPAPAGSLRNPAVGITQHSSDRRELLTASGIALALMAGLSLALGWLVAGRFLRPLRTVTTTAREISATNLHERLTLAGPDDELKELGDTFDELLARLERSFQFERQFVANASHELRTPLATMRAALDVAMAKPGSLPPQTVTLADRLRHELDHIDRLLESFLTLAHAQRGPVDDESTLSLTGIASAAIERHSETISLMKLTLEKDLRLDARVRGSETLVSRMVDNLIENAINHNEAGGWVRVKTAVAASRAVLVVENGGPVLAPNDVKELAQPFRRLGAERTGSDNGAGLGLSIVSAIAEVHGGTLELHARPDGGLQVVVSLPLAVGTTPGASACEC